MAAAAMETDLPEEMTVAEEYDVSASMSLAGHADTVSADIGLAQGETSADVTITQASAAPEPMTPVAMTESTPADTVEQKWTVSPDEPGQVDLVFTADVNGRAEDQELQQDVPIVATVRAVEARPSFWDNLQKPVLYLTPFAVLAATLFGLWTAWSKRQATAGEAAASDAPAGEAAGDTSPPADQAP